MIWVFATCASWRTSTALLYHSGHIHPSMPLTMSTGKRNVSRQACNYEGKPVQIAIRHQVVVLLHHENKVEHTHQRPEDLIASWLMVYTHKLYTKPNHQALFTPINLQPTFFGRCSASWVFFSCRFGWQVIPPKRYRQVISCFLTEWVLRSCWSLTFKLGRLWVVMVILEVQMSINLQVAMLFGFSALSSGERSAPRTPWTA